jgi:prevent-host-death family protein
MASATVREVQHQLKKLLGRVAEGEVITVTKHGKPVARLVPATANKTVVHWPDSAARMKGLPSSGRRKGRAPSRLVLDLREERS